MAIDKEAYKEICSACNNANAILVAVSKKKPIEDILALYHLGHRDFGENYVQELIEKQAMLPTDIHWHFIGHLQSNKVKYIAPFVHLVHGVDSLKLLKEINKHALKNNRVIDVLLQIHIAREETKFGLDAQELSDLLQETEPTQLSNICIRGLMGMASFSDDKALVRTEFNSLKKLFDQLSLYHLANLQPDTLSMGMSDDHVIALEEGSTMVRIGSILFGART